ncbi:MAG: hypothetical protein GEU80_12220 [Dehalococcoidia bacterium]|nr:hypothetical protein [Dehalococcoidia bacterium]
MGRQRSLGLIALSLVGLALSGCDLLRVVHGEADAVAAVEHVTEVLAEAGREPPALPDAVRFDCGPTDALLGRHLSTDAIHIAFPFADLVPVLDRIGASLPPPEENPLAGAPAYIDRWETSSAGWTVRWGESLAAARTSDGSPATTVTFVEGGDVSGEVLRRWVDDEVVVDLRYCG